MRVLDIKIPILKLLLNFGLGETDTFTDSDVILGYAGIITGIGTTTGTEPTHWHSNSKLI